MVGPTISGTNDRLASEGVCDANFFATYGGGAQGILDAGNAALVAAGLPALAGPPAANDDIDDLFEIWELLPGYDPTDPLANVVARDCDPLTGALETSPRNILVLVIEDILVNDGAGCAGGSGCHDVQGYTRMYLEGCSRPPPVVHRLFTACAGGGGDLWVQGRMLRQENHADVGGRLGFSTTGEFDTILTH